MDSNFFNKLIEPALTVICPAVVCALVGFVFFGTNIFIISKTTF